MDRTLSAASDIRVLCPLGTDLHGTGGVAPTDDVTIRRFPMCVPKPVPATGFSGQVALVGYLTPTGSRYYDPPCLGLDELVMARVDRGRITGFEGGERDVRRVESHYARIAETFSIDPTVVHSWHAGIHAGCDPTMPVAPDPDRWSNSVFGSPSYLHLHTCGDYAPGEICWMVANPTVVADGVTVWDHGRLAV